MSRAFRHVYRHISDIFCNNTIFVLVLSETKGDVILNLIKKNFE